MLKTNIEDPALLSTTTSHGDCIVTCAEVAFPGTRHDPATSVLSRFGQFGWVASHQSAISAVQSQAFLLERFLCTPSGARLNRSHANPAMVLWSSTPPDSTSIHGPLMFQGTTMTSEAEQAR